MDTKTSLRVLGVLTVVNLITDNAEGRDMLIFKKPFFSSNIESSKAFKDQLTVTGSEYPSGYTKSFHGSRYKFVDSCQGANRFTAQSDCERDSAHLVFIETKEEQEFLIEHTSPNDHYWIGLLSPKRHLFWDNGRQVTFVNLDQDNIDTDNHGTGCYKMSKINGRYWLDRPCGEKLGFICEYEGSGCPYDITDHLNKSCYKFVNDYPASRTLAQLKCKNDSSHLVFIESKEENDFLIRRAQYDTDYWIGLHDRPQLFWDNGSQMTYGNTDHSKNRTIKNRSGCYRMSNTISDRLWHVRNCASSTNNYPYICEYKDKEGCSSGREGSFKHSCYKFVNSVQDVNRSTAKSACERNSSHLVFIETEEEHEFLRNQTSPNVEYWIGLFSPKRHLFWDSNHEVTFANIDHGDKASYDNRSSCYKMSLKDGRYWLDASCQEKIGYICEFKGPGCSYDTIDHMNDSCYKFVNNPPASGISAQLKCENYFSHLVSIETKDENDFLISRAQNNTEYWIGLHDRPQLFWDNGKGVTYDKTDVLQDRTFDGRTGCYVMSDHEGGHTWFDRRCEINYGYICEYEGE